jgi:hypothetical protein
VCIRYSSNAFTESFPSSDGGVTHTGTQSDKECFMKYDIEMGSGAVIPSFTKIGSGIQKLIRGDSQTHIMVIS